MFAYAKQYLKSNFYLRIKFLIKGFLNILAKEYEECQKKIQKSSLQEYEILYRHFTQRAEMKSKKKKSILRP